jgi:stress response protein YsnF
VNVGKRQVQDTEHVTGTVRKEEVRVEKQGDVDVTTKGTAKDAGRRDKDR